MVKNKIKQNEKGAAMLEMSIVGMLFIFIIGFLMDVLLLFFRTQVLISAVTEVTRDISINHYQNAQTLQEWAPRHLRNFISSNYIQVDEELEFGESDLSVQVRRGGNDLRSGGACLYEISAQWSQFCIFCLIPIPPANATAQAFIEDECYTCL